MRGKTGWWALGAIVGVAAVSAGWRARWARNEAERARTTAVALQQERTMRYERAHARFAAAEAARAELQRQVDPAPVAKPEGVAAAGAGLGARRALSNRELMAADPRLEARYLKWMGEVAKLEYGAFYRWQGLSAGQVAKFEENLSRLHERQADLSAVELMRDGAGKESVAAMRKQAEQDYEMAQAELLGAEGCRQLQDYLRTLPLRNVVVHGITGMASLEGMPLTWQQGERLLQAALAATGDDGKLGGMELARALDWEVLDAEAKRILTPEQFRLFKGTEPMSGFDSRWDAQVNAAVARAAGSGK